MERRRGTLKSSKSNRKVMLPVNSAIMSGKEEDTNTKVAGIIHAYI